MSTQDKWLIPVMQWNKAQHKEYRDFRKIHNLWLASGIWRHTSFKDFMLQLYAILKKHDSNPLPKKLNTR